jgi:Transposase DDE domain
VSFYPAASPSSSVLAGEADTPGQVFLTVPAGEVAWPAGHAPAGGEVSAAVVAGTARIRTGDTVLIFRLVAVVKALVRRDGRVQAAGGPCDHATAGVLEEKLDAMCGPGAIGRAAAGIRLCAPGKKTRNRLLTAAFVLRVLLVMTLMPGMPVTGAMDLLAGDLACLPWAKAWHRPSRKAFRAWCTAAGRRPLEALRDLLLAAVTRELAGASWHLAAPAGGLRPWSGDGTVIRVPDTPPNRAAFGGDGPYPLIRAELLPDAVTRAVLAITAGPAGGDKAAAEQKLLDQAMADCGWAFSLDRILLLDRNYPGAKRIRELTTRTHVLIRVKSDIPLRRVSGFFEDRSYLAEISGDGVAVTVRVIEYDAEVEGQDVPETFCLITDLLDWQAHPAADLAELYKRRWDGSETGLREDKSCITGSGPGTGPMLRSGTPELIWQELAALITATELVRAIARDAAACAVPARKGKRAGQAVAPRQISFTAARRAALASIRSGACTASLPPAMRAAAYRDAITAVSRCRTDVDRDRHRDRKTKSAYSFPAAPRSITTRTARAAITVCGAAAA